MNHHLIETKRLNGCHTDNTGMQRNALVYNGFHVMYDNDHTSLCIIGTYQTLVDVCTNRPAYRNKPEIYRVEINPSIHLKPILSQQSTVDLCVYLVRYRC